MLCAQPLASRRYQLFALRAAASPPIRRCPPLPHFAAPPAARVAAARFRHFDAAAESDTPPPPTPFDCRLRRALS